MTTTLIVPGLHSSGPDHWQTWFEEQLPSAVRVIQRDWHDAYLPDWAARVRRDIARHPGRLFIVAHSFGVLAAVQAAVDHRERIAGALLVAPADPDAFAVSEYLPASGLGFPAVVVASTNDPWMRLERAAHWADLWGADLINLGASGHINADAGFGPWPEGLEIFERLRTHAKAGASTAAVSDHSAPAHQRRALLRHTTNRGAGQAVHRGISYSNDQSRDLIRAANLLEQAGWTVRQPNERRI